MLELARRLRAETWPVPRRRRDVLHRALLPDGVGHAEVERPEVHRLVGAVVLHAEGDTGEALLLYVLAAHVQLDRALDERRLLDDGHSATWPRVQPDDRASVFLYD